MLEARLMKRPHFSAEPRKQPAYAQAMVAPWTRRAFTFDLPLERMPCVLDRLRGAPPRLEDKLRGVSAARLTRRLAGKWSVMENAGHLLDLDELHLGRLVDYEARAVVLRSADMENPKTWAANHNATPAAELVAAFRNERARFVARLEAWDPDRLEQTALHPRLQQPMRVIDMAFFVAEHDDHHLARIHELLGLV